MDIFLVHSGKPNDSHDQVQISIKSLEESNRRKVSKVG